jgi:hypothetical protein
MQSHFAVITEGRSQIDSFCPRGKTIMHLLSPSHRMVLLLLDPRSLNTMLPLLFGSLCEHVGLTSQRVKADAISELCACVPITVERSNTVKKRVELDFTDMIFSFVEISDDHLRLFPSVT